MRYMEQTIKTKTELIDKVYACSGQLKKIIVRAISNKRQPLSVVSEKIQEDEKVVSRYLSKTTRYEEFNALIGRKLCELLSIRVYEQDVNNRIMIEYEDE